MKRTLFILHYSFNLFLIFSALCVVGYYFMKISFGHQYVLTIRGVSLEVEVAHNDYLRKVGLMGRTQLDWDKGMLFIFPESAIQSFWMKNTVIPLSIAFINTQGKITEIFHMQPDRWDGNLATYSSKEKVNYALETNMGWFEKNGIMPGDAVHFSRAIQKMKAEY